MQKTNLIKVLLVDDDPEDIDLMIEVLEMSKIKLDIVTAKNGVEAMKILNKAASIGSSDLPDMVLLDLNMPRKNGHEVIKEMKDNEKLKGIPIVVLTTSDAEKDIENSYSQGVSCYITKPLGLSEFQSVVQSINNFWFSIVKYPEK